MYQYKAYNLTICSSLCLPELQAFSGACEPDISIVYGKVDWQIFHPLPSWRHFSSSGDSVYCYWNIIGKFLVRAGRTIVIEPNLGVEPEEIRLPLLGPVLAIALHQRNQLALHASSVAINGKAALFLGASGQGKSTTAASLYHRGHQLMTDDVAAIELDEISAPYLHPGFPRIKLWPEAATHALNKDPASLALVHPQVEKRVCSTADRFCQKSLPIQRIYLLTTGSAAVATITSLSHPEAVAALTENTYIPMLFGTEFPDMLTQAQKFVHICQCVKLAQTVSVCKLERPRNLNLLPAMAALIEQDLAEKSVVTQL